MGTSLTNINVHIIFHTKGTGCTMREEDLPEVFRYIGGVIRTMSGHAYMVGGRPDHVHILTSLPTNVCLADFIRTIKANTSRWIKHLNPWYRDFSWQGGYGAFSVSESMKNTVFQYIANQKEHHRLHSSQDEFYQFVKKNGMCIDDGRYFE